MANDYITLSNSNSSLTKKFKATALKTPWRRTDQVTIALDGTPDKAAGTILYPRQYILRVPYVSTDANYGTLANLKTFFELNNPNATPSDVITLTDHFGTSVNVIFVGEADPQPVSTIIDGDSAFYMVPVSFMEITTTPPGSGS